MSTGTLGPQLRRDARDNMAKLTSAALAVFAEQGLSAPLDEIAKRAGVSAGTLYNRFGSREALIDAVLPVLASNRLDEAERQAMEVDDPGERFALYTSRLLELQASCPALNDVIAQRYPRSSEAHALCARALDTAARLIAAGQRHGSLRSDFTTADLTMLLTASAAVLRSGTDANPGAWKRLQELFFDGIRTR
jgi:AcrR family transcriptional regulator